MKTIIKQLTRRLGIEISRYTPPVQANEVVALQTEKKYNGNALLSYTINPFFPKQGESFDDSHSCDWECYQIALTFRAMGYNVDVINYNNTKFIPQKKYHVFLDVLSNMERIAPLLDDDCTKIYQPSFAHWLSHNTGEYQRHLSFQRRKGIVSKPPRLLPPNSSAEYTDVLILRGVRSRQIHIAVQAAIQVKKYFGFPSERNIRIPGRKIRMLKTAGKTLYGLAVKV